MYIVFITETWPPEVNGVALTVYGYAHGLAARGHRVDVVRPGAADHDGVVPLLPARGVRIPRYTELRFGLPQYSTLRRRWSSDRPDAIYVATEGPLGGSAIRAARSLDIPAVTGFHTRFDDYAGYYGVGLLTSLVRGHLARFHRRGQLTLASTDALVAELQLMGIPNARKLSRGVDTTRFSPEHRDPELRRVWGVGEDTPVMLCVGRLAAEKNLELALRAYRAVKSQVPAARLVLVGDGPMREVLTEAQPDAIFTGAKTGDELSRHYASADLFLFPSLTETFGNVVLEAMASGLAVVAFDRAAAAEHIVDSHSGLIVHDSDEHGFIHRSCQAGTDRALRATLSANARKTALCRTPAGVISELERLLATLSGMPYPGALQAAW